MPDAGLGRKISVVPPTRAVTIDEKYKSPLYATGFIFADLKAGEHCVMYMGNMFQKKRLNFNLAKDEIKFIKIKWAEIGNPLPELVPEQEARKELQEIRHDYKQPIPFNKRGK